MASLMALAAAGSVDDDVTRLDALLSRTQEIYDLEETAAASAEHLASLKSSVAATLSGENIQTHSFSARVLRIFFGAWTVVVLPNAWVVLYC
jgi:hypothetical protein